MAFLKERSLALQDIFGRRIGRQGILCLILGFFLSGSNISYAEEVVSERLLVIRQAKELKNTMVGVEAYLIEDVLEITVEARMRQERPKIIDVAFLGGGLRKIHYKSREVIPPSVEDEDAELYPVTKLDGLVMFGDRTKLKELKGKLTKELFKLRIPSDKIKPAKRYQLWVEVESPKATRNLKFKFDLEDLPHLISQ
ncbi:MAG: hypothetical protein JW734_05815 [Candidatus Omnitrophica bacterium]|nr:hypothetical protein [Candidatus Omnitrophota bacterium]